MSAQPKVMFRWRDPQGVIVADISQLIRLNPAPVARYIARVVGQPPVEKERFACAKRAVEEWLLKNRVQASPSA